MRTIKNKKAMDFGKYFLFMFLVISLLTVFGGMTAVLTQNYDVNTSDNYNEYLQSFNADKYANQDRLELSESGSGSSSGEFSEYESSFKFGEDIKQTTNQTKTFIRVSGDVLGLPAYIWGIISGAILILLLVAIIYFIRGLNQ